jgi:hypothetical protein
MSHRISVPPEVEAFRLLGRVDYQDAFTVQTPVTREPEEWARLTLEQDAPKFLRRMIRTIHQAIGLQLAPADSAEHIGGWEVSDSTRDHAVLAVDGRIMTPRIIVTTAQGHVVATTQLRFDQPSARVMWAVVAPLHRAVARFLLSNTAKAERDGRHTPPTEH